MREEREPSNRGEPPPGRAPAARMQQNDQQDAEAKEQFSLRSRACFEIQRDEKEDETGRRLFERVERAGERK